MILANPGIVEEGFFPLDAHLRAGNGSLIDLLAVDATGALAVLEIDRSGEDHLLRRSLEHQGWILTQVHFLRRLYGPERIQPFRSPRAILLSNQYSSAFLARIAELPISISPMIYRLSLSGGGPSLRLERAVPEPGRQQVGPGPPRFAEILPPTADPSSSAAECLTSEELEAFYRFERQRLNQNEEGAVER
jgi:hypothetical protein